MLDSMIRLHVLENNPFDEKKGNNPFNSHKESAFKKCCKKYKKGKRCKKCPNRI